ncbi:MAG: hypothetical protein HQL41_11965 [Alphaproteobacteria bacterium]|nr:hypothetical protein [Alphaproteobacteria bacterium]
MLLILTSRDDLTADFLIVDLLRRDLPYFRLNTEDLTAADFHFEIGENGAVREVGVKGKFLDLCQVKSAWYRRAIHPTPSADLSPGERVFVAGELRHLAMGLVLNPDIRWVNPIDRVSVGENKLFQLQVAKRIGFAVPKTIVSRDHSALRRFVGESGTGAICKPIFHGLFFEGEDRYSVYTRRVSQDSFDPGSIEACPVLVQEEIERKSDVRVTFIGDKCFVAEIKGENGLIDWRDPDVSVEFVASSIATDTERMCRTMLSQLGLVYGAFDFIRRPGGELVFLEVNPTGEWAWLEDRLGFPMREAFVQLLFGE